VVAPKTGTPEQYAEEMGALWTSLTRTLGRLDRIAAAPEQLDELHLEVSLRRLQYALHLASEHAYGVAPPEGAESAHAELAAALAAARDATAAVVEAATNDVEPPLHAWRGALFRVRLARLRLAVPVAPLPLPEPPPEQSIVRPLLAFLLALGGALAFVAGATLALWPVWVAGLVAVCASVVCYRP
jgi:hypothetical protein